MSETIVLDPAAVAPTRQPLDITAWISGAAGVDWGDADIQAYMSDQAVGSSPVDYRLPNRIIRIPLSLRTIGATAFATIRGQVQQKAALHQRERGWVMRQVDSKPLYADVMNATLHLGGSQLQAFRSADVDAVLTLETLPDWYGDEVALDSLSGTGFVAGRLRDGGADAVVAGNYPGRLRLVVSNNSASDQRALLWGLRSRNYDSASTAALFYEASAMTSQNGAAAVSLAGASGGTVQRVSLVGGVWVPMLTTDLSAGGPLTHQGSYRVWARCHSTNAAPAFRLLWGVGSLALPVTNDAVQLPDANGFYLLDLGVVQLDATGVGQHEWKAIVQAFSAKDGDLASIDCVYLQPLDDCAGALTATSIPSPTVIFAGTNNPTAAASVAGTGTLDWTTPGNVLSPDGNYAFAVGSSGGTYTRWLEATGFGFALPSGATVQGIEVGIKRFEFRNDGWVYDNEIHLVKGGVVGGASRGTTREWSTSAQYVTYGSPTDLWGLSWTAADINSSSFGAAVSALIGNTAGAFVDHIRIAVWYTLAAVLAVQRDAVVYGSQSSEVRTDGAFRTADGSVYGPVGRTVGDLPRIPPSGLEGRPVEVFAKPSRGDLDSVPDRGLDGITVRAFYRPSYLFVPD